MKEGAPSARKHHTAVVFDHVFLPLWYFSYSDLCPSAVYVHFWRPKCKRETTGWFTLLLLQYCTLYFLLLFLTAKQNKNLGKDWIPKENYHLLDTGTSLYSTMPFTYALNSHTATVNASKMIVVGGSATEKYIYSYDFAHNEWTILGMMAWH